MNKQLEIFQVIAEETKSDTVVVNIKTNPDATKLPGYVYIGDTLIKLLTEATQ
jgi:hypothetical protein